MKVELASIQHKFSPKAVARMEAATAACIGKSVTIRLDRKETVVGVIDTCKLEAFSDGLRYGIAFNVDVLCGSNRTRRNFTLKSVPI